MTSLPSRLPGICPALRSIARQTKRPDRLVLSLPRSSTREGKTYDLPLALQILLDEEPWIEVHWLDWDVGPGTKLLGLLDWVTKKGVTPGADDVVMVLDDDHEYLPFVLAELQQEQLSRGPGHVTSYFAYFFRGLMIPQGADVIAFQPVGNFIPCLQAYHETFVAGDRACFLVDDLWIGFFCLLSGRTVTALRHLVTARGLQMVYTQTRNAKVEALMSLGGEDRRDCVTLRAFEALLQKTLDADSHRLAAYGGEAAVQRLRRLKSEVSQADARIAQLSAWVARESGAEAGCSQGALAQIQAELTKLQHLYLMQVPQPSNADAK